MTAEPPGRSRPWRIVGLAALPALFTVWLHLPVLGSGLLQDDLALLGYLVEPGTHDDIRWSRVADDFLGPWAFGNLNYYRPLVTLTLALELWLGGGAPAWFHGSCIAVWALTVWSWGILFGLLGGPIAALAGGLLLAAHPAPAEPISWVCTRGDFFYLLGSAWACILFVRHLRGRRGQLPGVAVASVLALLGKEPALLLPVWLVLLDVFERGFHTDWRARIWLHLRLCPLWLGYLAWRRWALGTALGEPMGAADGSVLTWFTMQAQNLLACCAPAGSYIPAFTAVASGALAVWVAAGAWWRPLRPAIALGALWIAVGLLPAQWLSVVDGVAGYRIVLAGCVGFAMAAGLVLARAAAPRWFRGLGAVLLGAAVTGLALATRSTERAYVDAGMRMADLCEQVDAVGRRAAVERPLVLLFAGHESDVPFLWPMMTWPIAETPVASADHPFVSLASTLGPQGDRWMCSREAGPWRALWQHGAVLCYWWHGRTDDELRVVPKPSAPIELRANGGGAFALVDAAAGPWPITALTVVADGPFERGELEWLDARGAVGGRFAIGAGAGTEMGWVANVDVGADLNFLVEATLDGLAGFRAALAPVGERAVTATAMCVIGPGAVEPLAEPLRGASASLLELAQRIAPSVPGDADPRSTSVVLLTAYCPLRFDFAGGRLVTALPFEVIATELENWIHVDRCYYYVECRRQGRPWRSAIDWFVLDWQGPR